MQLCVLPAMGKTDQDRGPQHFGPAASLEKQCLLTLSSSIPLMHHQCNDWAFCEVHCWVYMFREQQEFAVISQILLPYIWMGILKGSLIFILCVIFPLSLPQVLEEGKKSTTSCRWLDQSPAGAWRLQRNDRVEFTRIWNGQQCRLPKWEACMNPELVNLILERESVYKIKEEEHVKEFQQNVGTTNCSLSLTVGSVFVVQNLLA